MRTPTESGRLWHGARHDETPHLADRNARLVRFATWVLGIEAMLVVALGVSGLGGTTSPNGRLTTSAPPPVPELLGFRPSPAHSVLLVVTGILALGALWLPAGRRSFAVAQAVGYLLITAAGLVLAATTPVGSAWHLNPADHMLHGLLCLVGVALLLLCRPSHRVPRETPSLTSEPPATPDPK